VLSDSDKRLYSRQMLLTELGVAGQERLCAARTRTREHADARASEVATDYLARAGVCADAGPDSVEVAVPSAERVDALAGDPQLRECAAWLAGAFAAVEAIKAITGAGSEAELDVNFVLRAEES
jgi:hypothetical protein